MGGFKYEIQSICLSDCDLYLNWKKLFREHASIPNKNERNGVEQKYKRKNVQVEERSLVFKVQLKVTKSVHDT